MKVFCNTFGGGYGGGCIVVAANSREEAIKAYLQDEHLINQWWYGGIKTPETDIKNIDFYYYQLDDWEEIKDMVYNGKVPKVIIEDSYVE